MKVMTSEGRLWVRQGICLAMALLLGLFMGMMAGCTSTSTKLAIQSYQKAEQQKQLSFNNSYRIANEQMLLNLNQFVTAHPEQATPAIQATWQARNELEEARVQFLYGRFLSLVTAGQYLYDKQGVLNVWFEGKADLLGETSAAADAAKAASGLSVKDILKIADPTTRPASPDDLERTLNELKGDK